MIYLEGINVNHLILTPLSSAFDSRSDEHNLAARFSYSIARKNSIQIFILIFFQYLYNQLQNFCRSKQLCPSIGTIQEVEILYNDYFVQMYFLLVCTPDSKTRDIGYQNTENLHVCIAEMSDFQNALFICCFSGSNILVLECSNIMKNSYYQFELQFYWIYHFYIGRRKKDIDSRIYRSTEHQKPKSISILAHTHSPLLLAALHLRGEREQTDFYSFRSYFYQ